MSLLVWRDGCHLCFWTGEDQETGSAPCRHCTGPDGAPKIRRPRPPWGEKSRAWQRDYDRLVEEVSAEPFFVERSARIAARGWRCTGDGPDPQRLAWELADRLEVARIFLAEAAWRR